MTKSIETTRELALFAVQNPEILHTPAMYREIIQRLLDENAAGEPIGWRQALKFYAEGSHFNKADEDSWDTVSGEPPNFWCDEAGTATVEDGTVAAMALRGTPLHDEEEHQELEAVIACLGDDAAKLRESNPEDEMASNMEEAARLLSSAHGISTAPKALGATG
jgi:hypothetical protein